MFGYRIRTIINILDNQGGGKRRVVNVHSITTFVDVIGCSMAGWLRFLASKTLPADLDNFFFISCAGPAGHAG
jgi:hypothetical protein